MSDSFTTWVLGGIGTVVATLAAVVATLWKANETRNAKAIEHLTERVDECEGDRSELRVRVARLETRLGEGESEGHSNANPV